MIMKIMAVRDLKAEAFGNPFFTPTTGIGIRSFEDEVNRKDGNSLAAQHPSDFQLFELGTFENTSGTFETMIPKLIVTGSDVKKSLPEGISRV